MLIVNRHISAHSKTREYRRVGDLLRDRTGLIDGNGAVHETIGQRGSFDELEDERGCIFLESVHRSDVRMIERREDLGLALKAGDAFRIACEGVGQHLDRDVTLQPRVAGAVHLAHPAGAEKAENLEGTDAGAGHEGHVSGRIIRGAALPLPRQPDNCLSWPRKIAGWLTVNRVPSSFISFMHRAAS
jgi:hypothetical protein